MKKQTLNREQWLEQAVALLAPLFTKASYKVPAVRVSCGWPSIRCKSAKSPAIGECWPPESATDKKAQIFISPRLKDTCSPQGVLSVLVHEIAHAVVGNKHGHKAPFKKCAVAVGLEGKMTATSAGEELMKFCKGVVAKIGEYPHAELKPGFRLGKKQTTRLVKCECKDCGYNVRVTRKWLDDAGAPLCPCNSHAMSFTIPDDLGGEDNE